jgi:hypothetical protein
VRVGAGWARRTGALLVKREYTFPANLVKAGKKRHRGTGVGSFGGGGLSSNNPAELRCNRPVSGPDGGLYHPDYREDWELGDEPYRYYNW